LFYLKPLFPQRYPFLKSGSLKSYNLPKRGIPNKFGSQKEFSKKSGNVPGTHLKVPLQKSVKVSRQRFLTRKSVPFFKSPKALKYSPNFTL